MGSQVVPQGSPVGKESVDRTSVAAVGSETLVERCSADALGPGAERALG